MVKTRKYRIDGHLIERLIERQYPEKTGADLEQLQRDALRVAGTGVIVRTNPLRGGTCDRHIGLVGGRPSIVIVHRLPNRRCAVKTVFPANDGIARAAGLFET